MRSCQVVASTPLIAWMLTAGRTPPTPPRLPPLLVLLAASTPTPPTDWAALPASASFPPRSALSTVPCPSSFFFFTAPSCLQPHGRTRPCSHFINTHCAGTQDSRTLSFGGSVPLAPSQCSKLCNSRRKGNGARRCRETRLHHHRHHQGLFKNH